MVLFTSDLHLGHRAICKYRPRFKTTEEHDRYWINKILSLGKRDILFILGDFLFDSEHYEEYLKELKTAKCRIKLILGNHDSRNLYKDCIDSNIKIQLPLFSYKNMWLSHCPIHETELRRRYGCVHGHLHNSVLEDQRYFDVCPEKHNYEFVKLEDIKSHFERNKNEKTN